MQQSHRDRRKYPRADTFHGAEVRWERDGTPAIAHISNASLTGLFLESGEQPNLGDVVELSWQVYGAHFQVRAVVRQIDDERGMGVEFLAMEPSEQSRLMTLLDSLANHTSGDLEEVGYGFEPETLGSLNASVDPAPEECARSFDHLADAFAILKRDLKSTEDDIEKRDILIRMSRVLRETDILIQDYLVDVEDNAKPRP